MVPAGNKAKRLSLINHTTKTNHHHYHHHDHHHHHHQQSYIFLTTHQNKLDQTGFENLCFLVHEIPCSSNQTQENVVTLVTRLWKDRLWTDEAKQ